MPAPDPERAAAPGVGTEGGAEITGEAIHYKTTAAVKLTTLVAQLDAIVSDIDVQRRLLRRLADRLVAEVEQ